MKCWIYTDYSEFQDEGYAAAIVFAESEQEALVEIAERLGEPVESVDPKPLSRREQFDEYSPGAVPAQALLDDGWWFDCLGCHRRVESDGCECEGNCDLDDCACYEKCCCQVVCDGEDVFCSQECKDCWDEERRREREWEAQLRATVTSKFPGCTIEWASGYLPEQDGTVCFVVPGIKHGIHWSPKEPNFVRVSPVDMDAWNAYDQAKKEESDAGGHGSLPNDDPHGE